MLSPGFLMIPAFLLLLGPLVFFHELGHYWAGRWFGIGADTFSIGFGREVFGWTDKRGTRWKIGWLPLGGYVKFAGDMSPAGLTDPAWLELPAEERAKTFQSKPIWQRAIVVLAGPMANFILAFIVIAGFAMAYGVSTTSATIGGIVPNSAAAAAGLQPGDKITAVGGRRMDTFNDVATYVVIRAGERVHIDLERNGVAMAVDADIRRVIEKDKFGNQAEVGRLGFGPAKPSLVRVGVLEAPGVAFREVGTIIQLTGETLGQLLTGRRSIKDMSGVVGMAKASGEQLSLGWENFVYLAALISINLGFINLLPIPMLDGGHLLFYAIEAIRRRPVTERVQEWAFRGGLAVVLTLFLVVTFNDLGKFGLWKSLGGLIG